MKKIFPFTLLILFLLQIEVLSAENEAKFEECREKLIKAQALGVLYYLDWKAPEPRVVVGPTFFNISFDAKENFVLLVNCFLMAGEDKFVNFNILDWRTDKRVGRFSYGKLKMD